MSETWDDVNEQVKADWKAEATPFERVCEIIEQTHDGQSAAAIADRALVSEPTSRRHCKTLVNTSEDVERASELVRGESETGS